MRLREESTVVSESYQGFIRESHNCPPGHTIVHGEDGNILDVPDQKDSVREYLARISGVLQS